MGRRRRAIDAMPQPGRKQGPTRFVEQTHSGGPVFGLAEAFQSVEDKPGNALQERPDRSAVLQRQQPRQKCQIGLHLALGQMAQVALQDGRIIVPPGGRSPGLFGNVGRSGGTQRRFGAGCGQELQIADRAFGGPVVLSESGEATVELFQRAGVVVLPGQQALHGIVAQRQTGSDRAVSNGQGSSAGRARTASRRTRTDGSWANTSASSGPRPGSRQQRRTCRAAKRTAAKPERIARRRARVPGDGRSGTAPARPRRQPPRRADRPADRTGPRAAGSSLPARARAAARAGRGRAGRTSGVGCVRETGSCTLRRRWPPGRI